MRKAAALASGWVLFCCFGCHSAFVDAVVRNRTAEPVSLIELDYPSASFGAQALAPGGEFHYRFKVLGSGPTKFLWTNHANTERQAIGPELKEGDEGTLVVTLAPGEVAWNASFKNRSLAPLVSQPQATLITGK